jgi:hypothetical protein
MGLLGTRHLLDTLARYYGEFKKKDHLVRLTRFIKWNLAKAINRLSTENIIEMNKL